MKTVVLCLVAVIALSVGLWPQFAQQPDPLAATKKQHRDQRWSNTWFKGVSKLPRGIPRLQVTDYVDTDAYELQPDNKKAQIRSRLMAEHAAKRKSVTCAADVVIFGEITSGQGYITADDSNIYTVYKMTVKDIFRNARDLNLRPGSVIEVTASGGTGPGGQVVEDLDYSRLSIGQDHLLALKYDEEAEDYYVFDAIGIYKVESNGTLVRGDFKEPFKVRQASLASEPTTFDPLAQEIRNINCK